MVCAKAEASAALGLAVLLFDVEVCWGNTSPLGEFGVTCHHLLVLF